MGVAAKKKILIQKNFIELKITLIRLFETLIPPIKTLASSKERTSRSTLGIQ